MRHIRKFIFTKVTPVLFSQLNRASAEGITLALPDNLSAESVDRVCADFLDLLNNNAGINFLKTDLPYEDMSQFIYPRQRQEELLDAECNFLFTNMNRKILPLRTARTPTVKIRESRCNTYDVATMLSIGEFLFGIDYDDFPAGGQLVGPRLAHIIQHVVTDFICRDLDPTYRECLSTIKDTDLTVKLSRPLSKYTVLKFDLEDFNSLRLMRKVYISYALSLGMAPAYTNSKGPEAPSDTIRASINKNILAGVEASDSTILFVPKDKLFDFLGDKEVQESLKVPYDCFVYNENYIGTFMGLDVYIEPLGVIKGSPAYLDILKWTVEGHKEASGLRSCVIVDDCNHILHTKM